jgi:hypothetical protein
MIIFWNATMIAHFEEFVKLMVEMLKFSIKKDKYDFLKDVYEYPEKYYIEDLGDDCYYIHTKV